MLPTAKAAPPWVAAKERRILPLRSSGALNEGSVYEGLYSTGENGITGITFFNGRVLRHTNVNIKFLDVLYKSLRHIIFKNFILSTISKLKLSLTLN